MKNLNLYTTSNGGSGFHDIPVFVTNIDQSDYQNILMSYITTLNIWMEIIQLQRSAHQWNLHVNSKMIIFNAPIILVLTNKKYLLLKHIKKNNIIIDFYIIHSWPIWFYSYQYIILYLHLVLFCILYKT